VSDAKANDASRLSVPRFPANFELVVTDAHSGTALGLRCSCRIFTLTDFIVGKVFDLIAMRKLLDTLLAADQRCSAAAGESEALLG
jgi:hypothetical protein